MASGQHHEQMTETPPPMPSERSTGIVFTVVLSLAALLLRHIPAAALLCAVAAAAMLATALLRPTLLGPLNRAWFQLALLLNRIVSPVVMFILYAIVIVPAGLIMQTRRDPLLARARGTRDSYWIDRAGGPPQTGMRDQF